MNNNFVVSIITYEEAKKIFSDYKDVISLINNSKNYKFCKAKIYPDFLRIIFSIPDKLNHLNNITFLCVVTKKNITFIDNSGKVGACIKKMQQNMNVNVDSVGRFIYNFLETLVDPELQSLEEFSNRLIKLENSVINSEFKKFDREMFTIKKEILSYYRYYSQLADVAQELRENENGFFNEENLKYFKFFKDRIIQLQDEAKIIREYTIQLRSVYQSQLDMRQNKIMKVLTIVTTIFSPLTIIVGWYGMNFVNMPELNWEYGYAYVTILGLIVTLVCLWILKKKKLLQ